MNDERTIYDAEQPKSKPQQPQQENNNTSTKKTEEVANNRVPNKKPMWQRAAVGAGVGILAGAATTVLTSGITQEQAQQQEQPDINGNGGDAPHPAWTDGNVPVASSVNDNMSFTEAFNAARAEVGAGGAFEWHGNIYNTYYEDEWEGMTAAERAEFGNHFSWNDHHNDVADSLQTAETSGDEVIATVVEPSDGDEVEADVVVPTDVVDIQVENDPVAIVTGDVEILGVVHDDDSGTNIGGMMIDGHEAVVIDVNDDLTFDILGVDTNDNHELEDHELLDISEYGVTVDDLNGMTNDITEQTHLDTGIEDAAI